MATTPLASQVARTLQYRSRMYVPSLQRSVPQWGSPPQPPGGVV
jgi:hypothetical protein